MDKAELINQVNALADKMDAKTAAAFLASVDALKESIDWKEVETLLSNQNYNAIVNMFSQALVGSAFIPFSSAITDSFVLGGKLMADTVPPFYSTATGTEIKVFFDAVNPKIADTMSRYKMGLIREITQETQAIIQSELSQTVIGGINPVDAARRIRDSIGLTIHQQQIVNNFKAELELVGYGPAESRQALRNMLGRKLRDKRWDKHVIGMARDNRKITKEKIDKIVGRYQERMLKHRAETIARTESIRALNMANQALWEGQVNDGIVEEQRVERLWIVTRDGHARDSHITLGSKYGKTPNGVGLNEPFISPLGPIKYPGDPSASAANTINCRCTLFFRIKSYDTNS